MDTVKTRARTSRTGGFVLGRARFEKISAVEGITTAPATQKLLSELERAGATAEERRAAIAAKFVRSR